MLPDEILQRPLPGADLVAKGLADLRRGEETAEALLVSIGRPRLVRLGFDVPERYDRPEIRLYERLAADDSDGAHARYNAFVRRLVSFERAAECEAVADAGRVRELMRALGRIARESASIYFTDGATAVLYGWRGTTVDVDLRIEPAGDALLRGLVDLKERLSINIELASPEDFVPVASNWRERSPFIERHGRLSFHHFDLHSQALSKAERSHQQDVADVRAMMELGLIDPESMWLYYARVTPNLHRYPALDRAALERSIETLFGPRAL